MTEQNTRAAYARREEDSKSLCTCWNPESIFEKPIIQRDHMLAHHEHHIHGRAETCTSPHEHFSYPIVSGLTQLDFTPAQMEVSGGNNDFYGFAVRYEYICIC